MSNMTRTSHLLNEANLFRVISASVVILLMGWFSVYLMDGKNSDIYGISLFITVLSITLAVASLILEKKITRAYRYHIIEFLVPLPSLILMFVAAFRLALFVLGNRGWILALLGLFSTAFMAVSQFRRASQRLRMAWKYNIKKGRLNAQTGDWDLSIPLYMDHPEIKDEQERRWKLVARLSPLAPSIGFAISRNLDGPIESLIVCILSFIFVSFSMETTFRLALAERLLAWESESGKLVKIKRGN